MTANESRSHMSATSTTKLQPRPPFCREFADPYSHTSQKPTPASSGAAPGALPFAHGQQRAGIHDQGDGALTFGAADFKKITAHWSFKERGADALPATVRAFVFLRFPVFAVLEHCSGYRCKFPGSRHQPQHSATDRMEAMKSAISSSTISRPPSARLGSSVGIIASLLLQPWCPAAFSRRARNTAGMETEQAAHKTPPAQRRARARS
jgi:hypothetical protein